MKDLKEIRLVNLLAALGLLYVGIDRVFFDRIVGDDPLSWIQRILTIVIGILLGAVSVSLFVLRGEAASPVSTMNTNSDYGEPGWLQCVSPRPLHSWSKCSNSVHDKRPPNILDFTDAAGLAGSPELYCSCCCGRAGRFGG